MAALQDVGAGVAGDVLRARTAVGTHIHTRAATGGAVCEDGAGAAPQQLVEGPRGVPALRPWHRVELAVGQPDETCRGSC